MVPLTQAELLKLSLVINDDDLDKTTIEAGTINNGQILHSFKDKSGEMRQSFYSLQAEEQVPDTVKTFMVGKKRTAKEAGFSQIDQGVLNQAI